MGTGEGKWSWPGRDLPYLYELRFKLNISCSIEPDIATWRKFGLVVMWCSDTSDWRRMKVDELIEHVGETEVLELLAHCRGTYLKATKDETLDWLGCPQ